MDDSEMVDGMVFDKKAAKAGGGPVRMQNAKIALVQFHISPPKTDLENNVIISDYAQVRRDSTPPSHSTVAPEELRERARLRTSAPGPPPLPPMPQ